MHYPKYTLTKKIFIHVIEFTSNVWVTNVKNAW